MNFISIKPILSDHLFYVTIFHCSLGRSHKTGLTVIKELMKAKITVSIECYLDSKSIGKQKIRKLKKLM